MTAVLKDDPPELSDPGRFVSPALERIVRRCLEKNPEQRFQSARDLSFALSALSGTETSSIARAAAASAAPRRFPILPLAAAVLALVAVCCRDLVCGAPPAAHYAHAVRFCCPGRNEHQPHGALARRIDAGVRIAGRKFRHAHALRAACGLAECDAAARDAGRELSLLVAGRRLRCDFLPTANCRK